MDGKVKRLICCEYSITIVLYGVGILIVDFQFSFGLIVFIYPVCDIYFCCIVKAWLTKIVKFWGDRISNFLYVV